MRLFLILFVVGCGANTDKLCKVQSQGNKHTMLCPDGTKAEWSDGSDGADILVVTSDEAEGDNCPRGGLKLEAGTDANHNETLDPEEISSTQYVCNGGLADDPDGVLDGDLFIYNSVDVAVLAQFHTITGSLRFMPGAALAVSVATLQTVDGQISASGPLTELQLPSFESSYSIYLESTDLDTLINFGGPSVTSTQINIVGNVLLSQCDIDEFVGRVTADSVYTANNIGSCP